MDTLTPERENVDALISQEIAEGNIGAISVAAGGNEGQRWSVVRGPTHLGSNLLPSEDTAFPTCSLVGSLVAVGALLLEKTDAIDMDRRVNIDLYCDRYGVRGKALVELGCPSLRDILSYYACSAGKTLLPGFVRSSPFLASGDVFRVLKSVFEMHVQQPLAEFLSERILVPLGMSCTYVRLGNAERLAMPYIPSLAKECCSAECEVPSESLVRADLFGSYDDVEAVVARVGKGAAIVAHNEQIAEVWLSYDLLPELGRHSRCVGATYQIREPRSDELVIWTTPSDYCRFLRFLSNGGELRGAGLTAADVMRLQEPAVKISDKVAATACWVRTTSQEDAVFLQLEDRVSWTNCVAASPARDKIVAIMINSPNQIDLCEQLCGCVFGEAPSLFASFCQPHAYVSRNGKQFKPSFEPDAVGFRGNRQGCTGLQGLYRLSKVLTPGPSGVPGYVYLKEQYDGLDADFGMDLPWFPCLFRGDKCFGSPFGVFDFGSPSRSSAVEFDLGIAARYSRISV